MWNRCGIIDLNDSLCFYSSPGAASQYVVTIVPDSAQVLLGRPYEMLCRVDPMPSEPVTFRWYHNDRMVGSDARLRLPSLAYPDIGNYVCRAEWTPAYSRTGSMAANATVDLTLALTKETEIGKKAWLLSITQQRAVSFSQHDSCSYCRREMYFISLYSVQIVVNCLTTEAVIPTHPKLRQQNERCLRQ